MTDKEKTADFLSSLGIEFEYDSDGDIFISSADHFPVEDQTQLYHTKIYFVFNKPNDNFYTLIFTDT